MRMLNLNKWCLLLCLFSTMAWANVDVSLLLTKGLDHWEIARDVHTDSKMYQQALHDHELSQRQETKVMFHGNYSRSFRDDEETVKAMGVRLVESLHMPSVFGGTLSGVVGTGVLYTDDSDPQINPHADITYSLPLDPKGWDYNHQQATVSYRRVATSHWTDENAKLRRIHDIIRHYVYVYRLQIQLGIQEKRDALLSVSNDPFEQKLAENQRLMSELTTSELVTQLNTARDELSHLTGVFFSDNDKLNAPPFLDLSELPKPETVLEAYIPDIQIAKAAISRAELERLGSESMHSPRLNMSAAASETAAFEPLADDLAMNSAHITLSMSVEVPILNHGAVKATRKKAELSVEHAKKNVEERERIWKKQMHQSYRHAYKTHRQYELLKDKLRLFKNEYARASEEKKRQLTMALTLLEEFQLKEVEAARFDAIIQYLISTSQDELIVQSVVRNV